MAFVHGKDGKVMINDSELSGDIRKWSVTYKRNLADTTALQDSGTKSIPGLHEGTMKIEGHFNSSAGRINDVITDSANLGVDTTIGVDNDLLVTVLPEGDTIGKPALFSANDVENYEVESEVDDRVSFTIEGEADGMVDMGVSQKVLGTQAPGTTNQASVDNGLATANGGAAILHTTAVSGGGNSVVKIQHSVDNSAWVDLITFTTVTAIGSERKELAQGTTVNRYTRMTATNTTGTYTQQCSFARR